MATGTRCWEEAELSPAGTRALAGMTMNGQLCLIRTPRASNALGLDTTRPLRQNRTGAGLARHRPGRGGSYRSQFARETDMHEHARPLPGCTGVSIVTVHRSTFTLRNIYLRPTGGWEIGGAVTRAYIQSRQGTF